MEKVKKLINTRQLRLFGYLIVLAVISVFIHEAAHVAAAVTRGIPFGELKIGFWGINPSVTLPPGLNDATKTIIFYAGGLTSGFVLLLFYGFYWVRKYHKKPSKLTWVFGMVTIALAAVQFSFGYLEGRYYSTYITGAGTILSPAHLLTLGWMAAALLVHFGVCPRSKVDNSPKATTQV